MHYTSAVVTNVGTPSPIKIYTTAPSLCNEDYSALTTHTHSHFYNSPPMTSVIAEVRQSGGHGKMKASQRGGRGEDRRKDRERMKGKERQEKEVETWDMAKNRAQCKG